MVGVVVVVGFDDAAMLLEPEQHIPDNPDVASIPEVIDIPDVADIADDVDIPDGIDMPGDIGGLPGVADVTGVVVPAAIPTAVICRGGSECSQWQSRNGRSSRRRFLRWEQ